MALTDADARGAKAKAKPYKLQDGNGLVLAVATTGRKTWRLRYTRDGRESIATLGEYPSMGVKAARVAVAEFRDEMAAGRATSSTTTSTSASTSISSPGPTSTAKTAKAPTILATAQPTFASRTTEYLALRTNWSASHRSRFEHRMQRDVLPRVGAKRVADISPADVYAIAASVAARGAVDTSKRVLQMTGQILTYAISRGDAQFNVAMGMTGALPDTPPTVHRPALIEPDDLEGFLDDLWSYPHPSAAQGLLQLGLLTLARPGEVRAMRWSDLDRQAREWRYTVNKTKTPHIVPLSGLALAVIDAQPRIAQSAYVFANPASKAPVSNALVIKLIRKLGWHGRMTAHGCRAIGRTHLVETLGYGEHLAEMQLAHAVRDVHGRSYNRAVWRSERHAMMQAWADWLDAVRTGAVREAMAA